MLKRILSVILIIFMVFIETLQVGATDNKASLEELIKYATVSYSINEKNTSSQLVPERNIVVDRKTGSLSSIDTSYSNNALINRVIELAVSKVGCEYSQARRESEDIFDCSSFVRRMYLQYTGVYIGSTTRDISANLADYEVSLDNLQPGDILYQYGHMGMYIGNDKYVHAAGVKSGVIISSYSKDSKFTNAFRAINYIKDHSKEID